MSKSEIVNCEYCVYKIEKAESEIWICGNIFAFDHDKGTYNTCSFERRYGDCGAFGENFRHRGDLKNKEVFYGK